MTQQTSSVDLTEGAIGGHFRTLAIPAAIGMLFNTLYNLVDTYFAGQLDTSSQAGLALGFLAFFVLISFGFGISSAMGALIGGALGRKDDCQARTVGAQGIVFALAMSVLLIAVGVVFGDDLIEFTSEPGPYRDAATRYFHYLLLSVPGFLLAYTCNGILQAQGDSVSMQHALVAAFFANVALNPLLIYGVPGIWSGMGFDGIALSTVISQSGVMVYMVRRYIRSDVGMGVAGNDCRPRKGTLITIAQQMLPTSFSMQIMILSGFVVQYALKDFGGQAIAAYGVGTRIEQLFILPIIGVSTSLLPIAAQNFGARDYDRVREAFFVGIKIGLLIMAVACPVLWFGAPFAMQFFSDDPDVIRTGVGYLRVDVFLLPIYAMLFIVNAFLQALKRPIWVLWIGIYRQGFGVVLFIWVFTGLLGFGIWGVWIGIGTSVFSGWLLSMGVASRVAKNEIGGLWKATAR